MPTTTEYKISIDHGLVDENPLPLSRQEALPVEYQQHAGQFRYEHQT
jgi:hypothetical protein